MDYMKIEIPETHGREDRRLGRHVEHDPRSLGFAHPVLPHSVIKSVEWQARIGILNQGRIGSCHDDQTEILTCKGWLPFSELTTDNELATVDPKTGALTYELPTRVVAFPYQGDIHKVENRRHNFAVTPDHKMLVRKWNESKRTLDSDYQFVPMADIGWYAGVMATVQSKGIDHDGTYTIPGVPDYKHATQRPDLVVDMQVWLRFLGIYLAEGTMLTVGEHAPTKIQLAGFKEREKTFIRSVLEGLDVNYCELEDRFTFHSARIYKHLESLGLKGVYAAEKFVPEFVFDLPANDIQTFLEGHREGDGSLQNGTWTHHTSSPQLAEDIQRLIFLAGGKVGRSVREPRQSTMKDGRVVIGRFIEHSVRHLTGTTACIERKKDVKIEHYDGMVYCAEVPTHHTLVTRRNGMILVSGNCTANASTGWAGTDNIWRQGLTAVQGQPLDETFAVKFYSWETAHDGIPGAYPPDDTGSSGLAAGKTLEHYGLCLQYLHAFSLHAIESALQSGPVLLGLPWHSDMMDADADGNLEITGEIVGGHELCAVGLDVEAKKVKIRNSWGTSFGQDGYFYLTYDQLGELMDERGDAVVPVIGRPLTAA